MRDAVHTELLKASNLTGMILTLDKYYAIEKPIGSISKNIIINNLVNKYEKQLNGQKNELIEQLKIQPNLKCMFGILDKFVDFVTPFENEQKKRDAARALQNNFDSIMTITGIRAR